MELTDQTTLTLNFNIKVSMAAVGNKPSGSREKGNFLKT
jgi:hypothetical protein